jgi:hypothetical protein
MLKLRHIVKFLIYILPGALAGFSYFYFGKTT